MPVNPNDVLKGDREIVMLVPVSTFGYLFVVTGNQLYLVAAILTTLYPALTTLIYNTNRLEFTNTGEKLVFVVAILLLVGFPLGSIATYQVILQRDVILTGLFLTNVMITIASIPIFFPLNIIGVRVK